MVIRSHVLQSFSWNSNRETGRSNNFDDAADNKQMAEVRKDDSKNGSDHAEPAKYYINTLKTDTSSLSSAQEALDFFNSSIISSEASEDSIGQSEQTQMNDSGASGLLLARTSVELCFLFGFNRFDLQGLRKSKTKSIQKVKLEIIQTFYRA